MDAHSLVGRKLGNGQYLLRELIALGGMGAVYLGEDLALKRRVAIKVLQPTLTDPGFAQRFDQEATTSAALDHPHIVKIFNRGSEDGLHYLVMQHLNGGSLQQRLAQVGGLPALGETARMVAQVASALEYAHRRGVIHRDIKTSNIMFDEHGNAILVDFGIAKLAQQTLELTGTGMAIGTPHYMAPEQAMGVALTPAADQYALGVVTYVMVTGRMPYEAPTPFAIQQKKLTEPLTPPPSQSSGGRLPLIAGAAGVLVVAAVAALAILSQGTPAATTTLTSGVAVGGLTALPTDTPASVAAAPSATATLTLLPPTSTTPPTSTANGGSWSGVMHPQAKPSVTGLARRMSKRQELAAQSQLSPRLTWCCSALLHP